MIYLDASALVKVVVAEPGREALLAYLAGEVDLVTSIVSEVEVARAVRRAGGPEPAELNRFLPGVVVLELGTAIAGRAARLKPDALRSLDAIHLATAMALGPELVALVTYDRRLAEAALANGLHIESPA